MPLGLTKNLREVDKMKAILFTILMGSTLMVPPLQRGIESQLMPMVVESPAWPQLLEEVGVIEKTPEVVSIEEIQREYPRFLEELGYLRKEYTEAIDLRNGVLRFQSHHNLIVDGSFGPQSQKTLLKRLEVEQYQYPDVVKSPPTKGDWITVNKTKRILTHYRGDQVINKYPIAQGKSPSLTPEGKFTIVNKVVNPAWGGAGIYKPVAGGSPQNPLGYRWMGLSAGGGGSYGIHGNNSPMSIGTNASLGCIRMINSDVEELFERLPISTIVWIGTDAQLQEWGVTQPQF